MGWKGSLRSLSAASSKANRESKKRQNQSNRSYNKIDKNIDQVLKKANTLQNKLKANPIKALGLKYDLHNGFTSQPFEFSTELFSGSVSLAVSSEDDGSEFNPISSINEYFSVRPLDILFTRWGTIVALEIQNYDYEYQIKTTSWHKKSDPLASSIFLLDSDHSIYYYPIDSFLSGETLADHPRVVLVAFEPCEQITNTLQVHISDVKMTSQRGKKYSFCFENGSIQNESLIQECLDQLSLVEQMEDALIPQVNILKKEVEAQASGCIILIVGIIFAGLGIVKLGQIILS